MYLRAYPDGRPWEDATRYHSCSCRGGCGGTIQGPTILEVTEAEKGNKDGAFNVLITPCLRCTMKHYFHSGWKKWVIPPPGFTPDQ